MLDEMLQPLSAISWKEKKRIHNKNRWAGNGVKKMDEHFGNNVTLCHVVSDGRRQTVINFFLNLRLINLFPVSTQQKLINWSLNVRENCSFFFTFHFIHCFVKLLLQKQICCLENKKRKLEENLKVFITVAVWSNGEPVRKMAFLTDLNILTFCKKFEKKCEKCCTFIAQIVGRFLKLSLSLSEWQGI